MHMILNKAAQISNFSAPNKALITKYNILNLNNPVSCSSYQNRDLYLYHKNPHLAFSAKSNVKIKPISDQKEKIIQFSQGLSGISRNGEILKSSNHITCYNAVVLNLEKKSAYMAHIWEGGYGGLSSQQKEKLEEFNKPLGRKVAIIIEGTRSIPSGNTKSYLEDLGIDVLSVIKVPSNGLRWDVTFNPQKRSLVVSDEKENILYDGIPFPVFTKGSKLSDEQRILAKLKSLTDPKTGELYDSEREKLKELLNKHSFTRDSIAGKLMYKFVEQRAKEAGYSNYCDYMDADPKNFTNVRPDSLELVLRKIIDNNIFFKRYEEDAHNSDSIHLTAKNINDLLKDYPETLKTFVGLA